LHILYVNWTSFNGFLRSFQIKGGQSSFLGTGYSCEMSAKASAGKVLITVSGPGLVCFRKKPNRRWCLDGGLHLWREALCEVLDNCCYLGKPNSGEDKIPMLEGGY